MGWFGSVVWTFDYSFALVETYCEGGVIAGMISGTVTVIIWDKLGIAEMLAGYLFSELIIPGMLPAFFVSLFIVIVVSLFTVPPETKKLFA